MVEVHVVKGSTPGVEGEVVTQPIISDCCFNFLPVSHPTFLSNIRNSDFELSKRVRQEF